MIISNLKKWDIDDLTERFYTIATKNIKDYSPSKGTRAKPFSKDTVELTIDFASCGIKYFDCKNRLLILGRAAGRFNQRDPNRLAIRYDPSANPKIEISKKAIQYSIEHEITLDPRWILTYRKTPYLKLMENATKCLNPDAADFWPDCIAYSNLFKFVPISGGNPSTGLVYAQRNPRMADILRIEIETLKPTHILLIVGEGNSYWYPSDFSNVIDKSGIPHKVVNRPEVRKREIRDSITNSIKEWQAP